MQKQNNIIINIIINVLLFLLLLGWMRNDQVDPDQDLDPDYDLDQVSLDCLENQNNKNMNEKRYKKKKKRLTQYFNINLLFQICPD